MLTYTFDPNSKTPLYEALYRAVKTDILKGALTAHDRLPSKRSLARHLGVSTITVENAYAQLISEGFLYALPKKGYFVADISGMRKVRPAAPAPHMPPVQAEAPFLTDLSGNRTDPAQFPFSIWAKLLRKNLSDRQPELMKVSPAGGVRVLREAIAGHLLSFRGMLVSPDQIVIGAGTEYLYGLLIQLLGQHRIYAVENPGYHKIAKIYRASGVTCRFVDMDDEGLSLEQLKKSDADIVHISPTHHFPTGITMPADRRYGLLAWASETDSRYIIEDDYDSEFRFKGRPIPTLQSMDVSDRVIYINTFSKSLASTIRISYMVLPPHLAERFYRQLSFYACTVSTFEQYTLADFIREGHFERHINRMRLFYARKREEVLAVIADSPLAGRCSVIEKDSGLHFLLRLETALPDEVLLLRLQQKQIHLSSLASYDQDPAKEPPHTFLLNYSNLDTDRLPFVFRTIAECM